MRKITIVALVVLLFSIFQVHAQGLVSQINSGYGQKNSVTEPPHCGSYEYMKSIDARKHGFLESSNALIQRLIVEHSSQKKLTSTGDPFIIPVVFHVVYNNSQENIPDSVMVNQINILNECYGRRNSDTANTRAEFKDLVGDSKIQFKLADVDPSGNATSGITRTNSPVQNFGGIIPYSPGQNQEIAAWVSDSLFYNYFRITKDNLGGKSSWDVTKYLNVWIGDLRIAEPNFNNFQELVYFAFSTPPIDHPNWPQDILPDFTESQEGVIIHYINVGANNPNQFQSPYNVYNGLTTQGKTLVHEAGHYLGLRHIWGDGDCSATDHIEDTPRSNGPSQFDCNLQKNSCVDTILGTDLHDMVENYMDYSSQLCQNSFTNGQVALMRSVLENYRSSLDEKSSKRTAVQLYPNPTTGKITIDLKSDFNGATINVYDLLGNLIIRNENISDPFISLDMLQSNGMYFVEIITSVEKTIFKVIKM